MKYAIRLMVAMLAVCFISTTARASEAEVKAVMLEFGKALNTADAAKVREICVGKKETIDSFAAMADVMGAMRGFAKACVDKYGDAAEMMKSMVPDMEEMMKGEIAKSKITVEGDVATVTDGEGKTTKVKKIDGKWKIDVDSNKEMAENIPSAEKAKKMGDVMKKLTAEVKEGKYATFMEAMQAMGKAQQELQD